MRSPEQIAADLLRCRQDGDNNVLADPNLVREAAEALRRYGQWPSYADAEAERDALIAFAQAAFDCECPSWAWYRDAWNALPEPLRHRIEAG